MPFLNTIWLSKEAQGLTNPGQSVASGNKLDGLEMVIGGDAIANLQMKNQRDV